MENKNRKTKFLAWWAENKFYVLSVLCAILYSWSGWLVQWLKESYTDNGQLLYRAISGIFVSVIWLLLVNTLDDKKNKNVESDKEKKELSDIWKNDRGMYLFFLTLRPIYNLCFIIAVATNNATIALMILLTVKLVVNLLIDIFKEGVRPSKNEIYGYLMVFAGIGFFYFTKPEDYSPIMLLAIISGILEAVRLVLIGRFDIKSAETPKFSVFELLGMVFLSTILVALSGWSVFSSGFFQFTNHALVAMFLLPTSSVAIMLLDYAVGTSTMDKSTYSAILATEIGFAGIVNAVFLKETFAFLQVIGVILSMLAIYTIKTANAKRVIEDKNRKKEIGLEG